MYSVIGISIARLVLVVKGQWDPDESWTYDPMLAIETAEIGGTLIALSIPGLKPMIDTWIRGYRTLLSSSSPTREAHGTFQNDLRPKDNGSSRWNIQGGKGVKTNTKHDTCASNDTILQETQYVVEEEDVEKSTKRSISLAL